MYAAQRSAVATIKPNVGRDRGPRCMYGIMSIRRTFAHESIHDAIEKSGQDHLWSRNPSESQIASATHSVGVKCPGKTGKSFINSRSSETAMPSPVTKRK